MPVSEKKNDRPEQMNLKKKKVCFSQHIRSFLNKNIMPVKKLSVKINFQKNILTPKERIATISEQKRYRLL